MSGVANGPEPSDWQVPEEEKAMFDPLIKKGDEVVVDTDVYLLEGTALEDVDDVMGDIPMLLDDGYSVNVHGWMATSIVVNGIPLE